VEPDLSLSGHPEVFVVGDAAAVPQGPGRPEPCPNWPRWRSSPGATPARQILRRRAGQPPEPFTYKDKGMMAAIGRRAAVAQLPDGLVMRGTLGWLAWLGCTSST
jgi:NADH dehydrogenase